jgi:hypothetical protein
MWNTAERKEALRIIIKGPERQPRPLVGLSTAMKKAPVRGMKWNRQARRKCLRMMGHGR